MKRKHNYSRGILVRHPLLRPSHNRRQRGPISWQLPPTIIGWMILVVSISMVMSSVSPATVFVRGTKVVVGALIMPPVPNLQQRSWVCGQGRHVLSNNIPRAESSAISTTSTTSLWWAREGTMESSPLSSFRNNPLTKNDGDIGQKARQHLITTLTLHSRISLVTNHKCGSIHPPSCRTCLVRSLATAPKHVGQNDGTEYDDDDGSDDTDDGDNGWTIPSFIRIPMDQLEMSFVRSSGAGGQNVNKVNSQVQIRLDLTNNAHWLPYEVRLRLEEQQRSRINKDNVLILAVQEHRTQTANRQSAIKKLEKMILDAWSRPNIRKQRTGVSHQAKRERVEMKRRRSQVKQNRRPVGDF